MTLHRTPANTLAGVTPLLRRRLKGSNEYIVRECARAAKIAEIIQKRWACRPTKWRLKHVRWFLNHGVPATSAWGRYRYEVTLRRLLQALNKPLEWQQRLPLTGTPKQPSD